MVQLLSNFALRMVTLDDCHIAEMFRKQLNLLAMHPIISLFRREKNLKYNHNLNESAKTTILCTFPVLYMQHGIRRYATSAKSNSRHDGDSHIAINSQQIRHVCNQNYNNIRIICSHINAF